MFFKLILIFLILEIKKVFETNLKLIKNIKFIKKLNKNTNLVTTFNCFLFNKKYNHFKL